jgi:outer membrane protein assembly factor BamB
MSENVTVHGTEVHTDTGTVTLPYAAHSYQIINDVVVVSVSSNNTSATQSETIETAEISIPDNTRNVIAVSSDGGHLWTAPAAPHSNSPGEIYQELFYITERLLATHHDEHLYELSIETGEIEGSWPLNSLPIGDQVVQLNGHIEDVIHTNELIIVNIGGVEWPESDTYAFEKDGSLRWQSEEMCRNLKLENGTLWAIEPAGGRMWERAPIDLRTGVKGDSEAFEGYPN